MDKIGNKIDLNENIRKNITNLIMKIDFLIILAIL